MKSKKNIIIAAVVGIIIFLVLDLINIRSIEIWEKLGIELENLNIELWSAMLIASVLYFLEIKREDEQLRSKKEEENKIILHEAKKFNLDNFNEINYYPLCQVADYLKTEFQIEREIYKQYILCEPKVKEAVLKLSICRKIPEISMDMVKLELEEFRKDADNWNLGECMFYDGFKYLHLAQHYFDEELPRGKQNIYNNPYGSRAFGNMTDLFLPIDYFIENEMKNERNEDLQSPYEIVVNKCRESIPDSEVCFYLMEVINNTIASFINRGILKLKPVCDENDSEHVRVTSEEIVTFEDYYYSTLLKIHNAYKDRI